MRTNRSSVRFGGIASVLGVLVLLVSACMPDGSDPVAPDVQYAKSGNGGGRGGGGGEEEPGSDGRFGFRIGYPFPHTGQPAEGVFSAVNSGPLFISSTVSMSSQTTDIGYLQEQFSSDQCFPPPRSVRDRRVDVHRRAGGVQLRCPFQGRLCLEELRVGPDWGRVQKQHRAPRMAVGERC